MESKKTKVFLVDDYSPMRESLRKMLDLEKDLEVCGEAGTVEEAYNGICALKPEVAIVDLVLGSETGLELLKRLNGLLPHLPVLVLSLLPESLNAENALKQGARGYIMKSESADQILFALREVIKGRTYVSPAIALQLTKRGHPIP